MTERPSSAISATIATWDYKSMSRKKAISRSEKPFFWHEEAPLKRLHAGPSDRRKHAGLVIGTKRTDSDWTIVAKMLNERNIRRLQA